jgi:hypothetical protein
MLAQKTTLSHKILPAARLKYSNSSYPCAQYALHFINLVTKLVGPRTHSVHMNIIVIASFLGS